MGAVVAAPARKAMEKSKPDKMAVNEFLIMTSLIYILKKDRTTKKVFNVVQHFKPQLVTRITPLFTGTDP
jgi:hypothetical protein